MQRLVVIIAMLGMVACLASTAGAVQTLSLGDFETGNDGWIFYYDTRYPSDYAVSREVIGGSNALKQAWTPVQTGPFVYQGDGCSLRKTWDTTGQGTTFNELKVDFYSWYPFIVRVQAFFVATGNTPYNKTLAWPGTDEPGASHAYTLTPADFGVTQEVFTTMKDLSFVMDQNSHRVLDNGAELGGGNPMWWSIDNVRLQGPDPAPVPEPASLVTLLAGAGMLMGRKR